MKKILFPLTLVAAILLLTLQSCDKVKDIVKANVPVTMEYDIVIPQVTDASQPASVTTDLAFDIDAAIKDANKQLGVGNVKSASLSSVTLSILPENQDPQDNLTALSMLNLSMSSDQKPEWVSICSLNQAPTEPYELNLPVNQNADLSGYFTSDNFHFKADVKANRTTTKVIKCKATIKFIVVASL
ncbi:hypothetical protein F0919_08650 [Taibaiella lutea]|uniref:DUF1735 domain-containing protein n=1 Tax=Taibaiella lutea TaxID=2608001 RepID=A0A5M6CHN4_9BACT|nr:hypothetical protein [Taibaiella lutea]KAA5534674.1 hypothetical protein F0919_08650 [Taibaiella lutea]